MEEVALCVVLYKLLCRWYIALYSLYAWSPTLGIDGYITLTFTVKYHPLIISIPSHFSP